jgi:hypothetical protein
MCTVCKKGRPIHQYFYGPRGGLRAVVLKKCQCDKPYSPEEDKFPKECHVCSSPIEFQKDIINRIDTFKCNCIYENIELRWGKKWYTQNFGPIPYKLKCPWK